MDALWHPKGGAKITTFGKGGAKITKITTFGKGGAKITKI
jgi:hypothetical protein